MSFTDLNENQWRTLAAIADGFIPPVDEHVIAGALPAGTTQADALAYARKSPSTLPRFRSVVRTLISNIDSNNRGVLLLLLNVLSYRATAVGLTGSPRLLTEMSPAEVGDVLTSWKQSRLAIFHKAAASLLTLSFAAYIGGDPEVQRIIGHPEPHPWYDNELRQVPAWEPPRETLPPAVSANVPIYLSTDVVIVGSGSSSMVVAQRLTKKGYSVLILEKGKFESLDEIGKTDFERDAHMDSHGVLASNDASISVLAGSTVGGGGAVNWSCSLRTPSAIREEFVRLGAPIYGTNEFTAATDAVMKEMHCVSGDDIGVPHSFTNQLILDASKKLGYKASATGQNTGGHIHNSHFLEFGRRHGADKGGVAEWLHYALSNGAKLIDKAQVVRIRHHNGRASGVDVLVNGTQHVVVNAKRVVVAAGSLHTPLLLQRSNFKNKHIGRGLKLHPVTCSYGIYPDVIVNRPEDAIMTAVCTESDNLDGQHHGPKIEAIHTRPLVDLKFLPWRSPEDYRRLLASWQKLSSLLVITRDKGEGSISYNPREPFKPFIEYTPSEYDLKALKDGSLTGSNIHYIGGAERIIFPLSTVPDFVSSKPKDQRSIWDEDYQKWYREAEKSVFQIYQLPVGCAHQMASCRMHAGGPKYGAVDERGHLYECPNVHVVDSSVMPAASGVNPMITTMATAYVLGDYLAEDLEKTVRAAKL